MAGGDDKLSPPRRTSVHDPGAHELESSESEDHFSDAQSGPSSPNRASPVLPKTRVEKVDNEPSYGEVPGTEAYRKREGDAEPDEIAIVPDRDATNISGDDNTNRGLQTSVPLTVVEETPDSEGSVTHPGKHHDSDPAPDKVLKAEDKKSGGDGDSTPKAVDTAISPPVTSPTIDAPPTGVPSDSEDGGSSSSRPESPNLPLPASQKPGDDDGYGGEEDDFGDDFDDFEEGGGAEDDDDFGDFDDGFQEPVATALVAPTPAPAPPPASYSLSFVGYPVQVLTPQLSLLTPAHQPQPVPDFEGLDADQVMAAAEPYLNAIYPPEDDDEVSIPSHPKDNPIFQTPRSASLWAQLVAPPPLQPPDWIRSRIRRLFLVSLGVPVDLDEILPASKQKKLILPSLGLDPSSSPSLVENGHVSRFNDRNGSQENPNASTTSLDSQGNARPSRGPSKRGKNEPVEPELDLVAAKQLCATTDEALDGMTDAELKAHVARLEAVESAAKEVLEYWKKRTDEKIGDREAFEGVIESLVKHARKVRK